MYVYYPWNLCPSCLEQCCRSSFASSASTYSNPLFWANGRGFPSLWNICKTVDFSVGLGMAVSMENRNEHAFQNKRGTMMIATEPTNTWSIGCIIWVSFVGVSIFLVNKVFLLDCSWSTFDCKLCTMYRIELFPLSVFTINIIYIGCLYCAYSKNNEKITSFH